MRESERDEEKMKTKRKREKAGTKEESKKKKEKREKKESHRGFDTRALLFSISNKTDKLHCTEPSNVIFIHSAHL